MPDRLTTSVDSRFRRAGTPTRVLTIVLLSVVGSGAFCYALYALVGVTVSTSGTGNLVALLAPLVTPAVVTPVIMVPIERSNRRVATLLAEVEHTRAALSTEVAERTAAQARLEELVRRDPLTGVLNRRGFFEVCEQRPPGDTTVVTVDVDHFKQVNDRWGHDAGDLVLRQFASVLVATVGEDGWVARTGGDEFVVLCRPGCDQQSGRVVEALAQLAVTLPDGSSTEVAASVGRSLLRDGVPVDEALRLADQRMFTAKGRSRSRHGAGPTITGPRPEAWPELGDRSPAGHSPAGHSPGGHMPGEQ